MAKRYLKSQFPSFHPSFSLPVAAVAVAGVLVVVAVALVAAALVAAALLALFLVALLSHRQLVENFSAISRLLLLPASEHPRKI